MWTVAVCRNVGAICFASILMRPLQLASAAACPAVPKGGFPLATELDAIKCINPEAVSGVPITSGHLILSGLEDISSKNLECSSTDKEVKALINGTAAASLSLGASTCSLAAIGLSKSSAHLQEASVVMRLDFNKCTLGQYDTSVFIKVVRAAPGALTTPTFVPFLSQVCEPKGFLAEKRQEKSSVSYEEVQVGLGKCVGNVMKTVQSVPSHAVCKMLCSANIQTHGNHVKVSRFTGCTGFSFDSKNPSGDNCLLHNGTSPTAVAPQENNEGFTCSNLTAFARVIVESTTAPPTLQEQKALDAALPRLNINVDLQAKSASVLTFFPADKNCSSPFNSVDIQDKNFQTVSVSVKNSEWAKLLARIPSPKRRLASAGGEKASYVLTDRLVYGSSGSMAAPPIPAPIVNVLAPTTPMPCRKVPAKVSNATTVFIINLILGVGGIGAAILSFEGGKKWAASKSQSYEPLSQP